MTDESPGVEPPAGGPVEDADRDAMTDVLSAMYDAEEDDRRKRGESARARRSRSAAGTSRKRSR